jgi:Ca2+-transporting ATPase
MGLTSFAIANLLFSVTARNELESVFSLDILGDRNFLIASGASIAAIILGTEFGPFQRFLDTQHLEGKYWLLCIGVALPVVAASEVRKFFLRRQAARDEAAATAAVAA